MKVIFLDIDGVLNNRDTWGNRPLIKAFDKDCIAAFNKIIDATGARIVISSSWRNLFKYEQLCALLRNVGVRGAILDQTPTVSLSRRRGAEIKAWLDNGLWPEIDGFIILDDETDMGELLDHLIQTDYNVGLTDGMADIAIERLRGNGSSKFDY